MIHDSGLLFWSPCIRTYHKHTVNLQETYAFSTPAIYSRIFHSNIFDASIFSVQQLFCSCCEFLLKI